MSEQGIILDAPELAQIILDDKIANRQVGELPNFLEGYEGDLGMQLVLRLLLGQNYQENVMDGWTPSARALRRDGQGFLHSEPIHATELRQELILIFGQFLELPEDTQGLYAQQVVSWIAGQGQRPVLGE